jgi:hypothetical protein
MFGGLTDIPRLSSYEEALAHLNDVKPIAGNGINAGIRPLCNTYNGRKKTQYFIRKKRHPAAASKQAIECVLYDTPVVTFVEDGTIYIDMSYPSITTHSFISEILREYGAHCFYGDSKTWLCCRGKAEQYVNSRYWWLPHGYGVTFKIIEPKSIIEPVKPRLMDRYVVNRSKAKEVYAKYAAFTSHCVALSKLVDPKQSYGNQSFPANFFSLHDQSLLQTAEPNEEWSGAIRVVLADAVVYVSSWNPITSAGLTKCNTYTLTPKKVRQVILDKLKQEHAEEIFEVTKAKAGVYTTCLNEEYIR